MPHQESLCCVREEGQGTGALAVCGPSPDARGDLFGILLFGKPSGTCFPHGAALPADALSPSGAVAVGCNKLGMRTKLQAAELATAQGIDTIITNGKNTEAIYNIVKGFGAGTLFKGKQR